MAFARSVCVLALAGCGAAAGGGDGDAGAGAGDNGVAAADTGSGLDARVLPACAPVPRGLVSWWRGERNMLDTMGANRASPEGIVSYGPGIVGSAFHFSERGWMVAGTAGFPLGAADRSVELWIELDGPGRFYDDLFFGYGTPPLGSHSGFGIMTREPPELVLDVPGHPLRSGIMTELHRPYHVAAVGTAGHARLYVDGRLAVEADVPIDTRAGVARFGHSASHRLIGFVDEVSVYDRALTEEEIAAIHRAGAAGKCLPN